MTDFDAIIARYAIGDFTDDSPLTDVGVDSLSVLRMAAELATDPAQPVWPERLARLRTVGDLKAWLGATEVPA